MNRWVRRAAVSGLALALFGCNSDLGVADSSTTDHAVATTSTTVAANTTETPSTDTSTTETPTTEAPTTEASTTDPATTAATPTSEQTPSPTTATATDLALDGDGIGGLKLGDTLPDAHRNGYIGASSPGCELYGPLGLAADLTMSGVEGSVGTSDGPNGTINWINIRKGRLADGGRIGDGLDAFTAASSGRWSTKLEKEHEAQFGIWILALTDRKSAKTVEATVSADTATVTGLTAPLVQFCE